MITTHSLLQFSNLPLVVNHPPLNSRRWASPPPRKAPRCSAAPVMASLRASSLLSTPPLAPGPSRRNASPASFRVRWAVCLICMIYFLFLCFLSSRCGYQPTLDKSVLRWHLSAWLCVFLLMGGKPVRLCDADEVVCEVVMVSMKWRDWWREADSLMKCDYLPSALKCFQSSRHVLMKQNETISHTGALTESYFKAEIIFVYMHVW